jgi:hypothetical protein
MGWFTWECRMFIDNVPGQIGYVGKAESLIEDMVTVLKMAGEKFSEKALRSIPRVNDSDMDGKSSKYWAPYSQELLKRVMVVESEVINRYYRDFKFDPNSLVGPRPY